MRRNLARLLLAAALLTVASEALSTVTDEEQAQISELGEEVIIRPKRLLRAVSKIDLAEKHNLQTLSKKLADKAWLTGKKADHKAWLKAGKNPQDKFKEYGWKGKAWEELKKDPRYARYDGFDDAWMKKQRKKGTIHTVDNWIKLWNEQQKKAAGTMATSICNSLGDDVPVEAKVTTSIVTIGIATASLGICLVVMGKLRLAALASYLPMPVIGGYLAYIGIFCFYAGLALCTGLVVNNVESMLNVFENAHDVLLCVPGVLGGEFLLVVSQRYDNSFILSGAIMIMPVVFFFIMLVHWGQLPKQFGTWLGMVFIVAFGSCLDIAAIELDMGSKLDFNHELKTVGWSNVVSGVLGGYSGSYIFSQTIFTYRSKINSRIVGVCVIIAEFGVVLAPVSVMSYVPRFFFAATLIFIAIDLMIEWLVLTYKKMSLREYVVLWLTFIAVNIESLDVGMLIGVGIAIVNFLLGYVRLPVVARKPRSSDAVRSLEERKLLNDRSGAIAYFELSGFLFFGSSAQILDGVQKAVYVRKKLPGFAEDAGMSYLGDISMPLTPDESRVPLIECLDGTPAADSNAPPTEYVIMDFANVTAMDATAARSAFLILQKYCNNHDIVVIYAGAAPEIQNLFVKNDVADEASFYLSAEPALEFCENQLLGCVTSSESASARASSINEQRASLVLQDFIGECDDHQLLCGAGQFFKRYEVPTGHEFYASGQSADHCYFLARGSIATSQSLISSGSLFGEADFINRQQRQSTATATQPCTVFELSREAFESMQESAPALWIRVRDAAMQSAVVLPTV
ncbi:hypothetical protein ON010_g6373 [Phytophthora cinnamomi]|nr:hypothetical protein ON010_g6373 [Phytophthora cinnamomi]